MTGDLPERPVDERVGELIADIERILAEGADVDAIVDRVHQLVQASPLSIASGHDAGVRLYRATKHHQCVPAQLTELWYPPAERTHLGRANRAGQPAFYCSSDPTCAYREIGVVCGDMVVHATWITTAPMLLHDLGYAAPVFDRAGARRTLPEHHRTFRDRPSLSATANQVRDFLALSFTEPGTAKYALTAAIAEVHLRADEFCGLMYPSVSKAANVDNLALRPEFVHDGLRLDSAQLVKVDEITDDGSIGGVILADLLAVALDGSLSWKFRDRGTDVPPGGQFAMRVGDSLTLQTPGEITLDGLRYSVQAGYVISLTEAGVTVRDLLGHPIKPSRRE